MWSQKFNLMSTLYGCTCTSSVSILDTYCIAIILCSVVNEYVFPLLPPTLCSSIIFFILLFVLTDEVFVTLVLWVMSVRHGKWCYDIECRPPYMRILQGSSSYIFVLTGLTILAGCSNIGTSSFRYPESRASMGNLTAVWACTATFPRDVL